MTPHVRGRALAATVLVSLSALAGCSTFGDSDAEDTATATGEAVVPDISVTIPPARLTPFCQAMIDLADELENDPPADEGARIREVYEGIVDEVPPDIRDDFLLVLARLQSGGAAPSTTAPPTTAPTTAPAGTGPDGSAPLVTLDAEEGYTPDGDPALRLNDYIQATCRGTQNNPGPAATQPP